MSADRCETCKWHYRTWDDLPCDACTNGGEYNFYVPKDAVSIKEVLEIIDSKEKSLYPIDHERAGTAAVLDDIRAAVKALGEEEG